MLKRIKQATGLMGMAAAVTLLAGCFGNDQDDYLAPPAVLGPTETAQPPGGAATTPPPPAMSGGADEPFSLRAGEQLVNHKVVKGDSVWKLARQYNTRVSRIVAANNLESENMIIIGQTLKIPTTGGAPAPLAPAPPAPAPLTPAPLSPTPPAPVLTPPAPTTPPPAPLNPVPTTPPPAPTTPPPAPTTPPPNLNFGTPPAPSNGGGAGAGTGTPSAPTIQN